MQRVPDESLERVVPVGQDLDEVNAQDVDVRERAHLLRTQKMKLGRAAGHWRRVCCHGPCPHSIELSFPAASVGLHKVFVPTLRQPAIRWREHQHFAKSDHLRTRLLRRQHDDTKCETDDRGSSHAGSILERRAKGNGPRDLARSRGALAQLTKCANLVAS